MRQFEGLFTALVTPFTNNGSIDYKSLKKLIVNQLEKGVQGFVVNGTTAESPTLSFEEKKSIFEFVKAETANQVPLIFGSGSNNTSESIELSKQAEAWGADGLLVVCPYYNKPNQRGLEAHFTAVAKAVKLPIMLYNVPSRTVVGLEADTVAKLSKLENIVAIKEASGDISLGKSIVDLTDKNFLVSSGDDLSFIDLSLHGGKGIVSVCSHILPELTLSCLKGAVEGDSSVNNKFSPYKTLINYLYIEPNPVPVKYALCKLGIIDTPKVRLPLVNLSEIHAMELEALMTKVNLKL